MFTDKASFLHGFSTM